MVTNESEIEEPTAPSDEPVSWGRRISILASIHPDAPAIHFAASDGTERMVTWQELDLISNRWARHFQELGLDETGLLMIALPNSPEHYFATYAGWKLGALVLPTRSNLPPTERDQILEVSNPALVIGNWEGIPYPQVSTDELYARTDLSDAPLPDKIPHPGRATGSGGSTGRSKVIVDPRPMAEIPGELVRIHWRKGLIPRQVQLVAGALYHNSPATWSHFGLFEDHTLVLMERFDAAMAVDLIEKYRVNFGFLAPTMMKRIIDLPNIHEREFSSINRIFQTSAPCAPWLKRAFMDLIGAERLFESFGSSEAVGSCDISGPEWLEHPGSVGRPRNAEMKILDENFQEVPTGTVGEIFMRPLHTTEPTYFYLGSPPAKTSPDGMISVGDLGWVDEEGYLFLADRRADLIISGGANIYPAEVEAILSQHPEVVDVVVVGVPDDEWGKRVHAIIHPRSMENPPSISELNDFIRQHISSYKAPKSYEFMAELPRDGAGKIRRSQLAAERAEGAAGSIHSIRDLIQSESG